MEEQGESHHLSRPTWHEDRRRHRSVGQVDRGAPRPSRRSMYVKVERLVRGTKRRRRALGDKRQRRRHGAFASINRRIRSMFPPGNRPAKVYIRQFGREFRQVLLPGYVDWIGGDGTSPLLLILHGGLSANVISCVVTTRCLVVTAVVTALKSSFEALSRSSCWSPHRVQPFLGDSGEGSRWNRNDTRVEVRSWSGRGKGSREVVLNWRCRKRSLNRQAPIPGKPCSESDTPTTAIIPAKL